MQDAVERGGILVAEFIERAGEAEGAIETYPAYVAAIGAILAHPRGASHAWLHVASEASIGSGHPFRETSVPQCRYLCVM